MKDGTPAILFTKEAREYAPGATRATLSLRAALVTRSRDPRDP
jgi:hypothetical protein